MKEKNRKIYIVLTYTGTVLSKVIKYYTKAEYSHVSIALDEDLNEMYSFGRLNAYNPFIGGFVREGVDFGTFKRFKNTTTEIYSLELTDKQYKRLKQLIKKMKRKRNIYRFNLVGLFASGFNIKVKRNNCFYCSEFVKYIMEKSKVEIELPELIKPNDFKYLNDLELEYHGKLKNYRISKLINHA